MGEKIRRLTAQKRLLEATALYEVDLSQCDFVMTPGDRELLEANDVPARLAIARLLISQAVQAAYPQGLDRREGQLYAGWQESLCADFPAGPENLAFQVTQGQVEWLHGVLARTDLKLPAGYAQWREALIDYLENVKSNQHPIDATS